ncbi:MAG: DUF3179 domain-containing (seleno)protein [Bacteroidota bacterium]
MRRFLRKLNNKILCWTGSLLLIIPSLLNAYWLMPFPGSQEMEMMEFCYSLEKIIFVLRVAGVLFLTGPVLYSFFYGTFKKGIGNVLWCLLIATLYYLTDYVYCAQEMFKEPMVKKFLTGDMSKVPPDNLVIGIENNGQAKAYPINFIGYHHKVQDSVGGKPVLVTYCTMCRTGRIYSPIVNGRYQKFRLVGARHYNAVMEDEDTKTWWYQATGEAAAGPMRGEFLEEIPCEQMALKAWLEKFPNSLILQPDSGFYQEYADLMEYDRRQRTDSDSLWQRKSWVIGIIANDNARAYEWKDVSKQKLINDNVDTVPVLIFLEKDNFSFHAWLRKVNGGEVLFKRDSLENGFNDVSTHSKWNANGVCIDGVYKGQKLTVIQAYQEYWHSWKFFHAGGTRWGYE